MTIDSPILYLCRGDVEAMCRGLDVVQAVSDVLRLHAQHKVALPDEAYLSWTSQRGESARSLNMPSFVGGGFNAAGTKIINGNPGNPARGLPRASGLTLLFDVDSARVTCVLEASYISAARTAAISAISAILLGKTAIERLTVIGAGALARAHLELLPDRLSDLRAICLYDVDVGRAATLRDDFMQHLAARDIRVNVAADAETAVRDAEMVVTVTTTTTSYIPFDWLSPGALVVNVSLDDVGPDVVLNCDRLVVDDWNLVRTDDKRLLGCMYRRGLVDGPVRSGMAPSGAARRVDAELGEIVDGSQPGRLRAAEIILVNPFGMSIEDIGVATRVYERACALQVGTWLKI